MMVRNRRDLALFVVRTIGDNEKTAAGYVADVTQSSSYKREKYVAKRGEGGPPTGPMRFSYKFLSFSN